MGAVYTTRPSPNHSNYPTTAFVMAQACEFAPAKGSNLPQVTDSTEHH